jgi:hypothetical protein
MMSLSSVGIQTTSDSEECTAARGDLGGHGYGAGSDKESQNLWAGRGSPAQSVSKCRHALVTELGRACCGIRAQQLICFVPMVCNAEMARFALNARTSGSAFPWCTSAIETPLS